MTPRAGHAPAAPAPLVIVLPLLALLIGCAPHIAAPGPAVAQPALEEERLVAADGTAIAVHSWRPERNPPAAVVIALHGFNDYGTFIKDAAGHLAEHGIATYAYDQRGFGATPARGFWPGNEALIADLGAMTAAVKQRHRGTPIFLLGESMGAAVIMVAMTSASAPDVDGIILSAPAVWGRAHMPFYQRWALALSAYTVPWLTVTGRGLDIIASDNVEMLIALGRDPLVIKKTRLDAIHGLVGLMDAAYAAAGGLDDKTLLLYGEHDEVIPREPMASVVERLPDAARDRQRIALYDTGYHMLLRDLQAKTVWRDVVAWIKDPGAPLPSGADRDGRKRLLKE